MSRDHDCGGDAAAYVLGALEPGEVRAFESHLEQCVVCQDEVDSLQQGAHAVPMAAPQHPVPKQLRRRVLKAVRDEARDRSAPAPAPARTLWRRPAFGGGVAIVGVAAAAVALVLALSGGNGSQVIPARVAGVSGTAELRLAGGHGELIVRHMTPPPSGEIYEVWLKAPRQRIPSPANVLFSVAANGGADVKVPGDLNGISQVMVTPEPAGGSRAPTHDPVIVATLT